jgi:hypothetical protein
MASPQTLLYGTNGQAITCTTASLASAGARASTVINNSTNLWIDTPVQYQCTSGSTGTSATGIVNLYVYDSMDAGTIYSQGATGSDAAITLTVPPNAFLIGSFNVVANSVLYTSPSFSISKWYDGRLPNYYGVIVQNLSGHALAATAPVLIYQGVAYQA